MIDFIKIRIKHPDIDGIRNHPLLEWSQTTSEQTGEIKEYMSKFNGITFSITKNTYLNISGSLHKHWNLNNGMGNQNFNDFARADLTETIDQLYKTFNLLPENCIIENFEFGVNVIPPIPVTEILKSVIHHKGKPFYWKRTLFMNFLECEHRQYFVKIYDKGLQFDQGRLLRFEVKTRKMDYITRANIKTLSDLTKMDNLAVLGSMLADNFGMILFNDPTVNTSTMNHRDGMTFEQCRNPKFWDTLKPDNYYKKRNRFRELCKKYGSFDIQKHFYPLIVEKWNDLLHPKGKTLQDLTGVSGTITIAPEQKTLQDLTGGVVEGEKPNITGIDTSIIGSYPVKLDMLIYKPGTPPRRYCLTCGRDISSQKQGSKFCSAKEVGYVEAHRCRNHDSNPRNRIIYLQEREKIDPPLFDTSPFFVNYRSTRAINSN